MKNIISSFTLLTPFFVLAQTSGAGPVGDTIVQISAVVTQLIPLLLSLAVLMFLWGIVKFIANIGDEEARKAGKSLMVWGMIALFVMVSFWGIIGYVQQSLGLQGVPVTPGSAPSVNPVPSYAP